MEIKTLEEEKQKVEEEKKAEEQCMVELYTLEKAVEQHHHLRLA